MRIELSSEDVTELIIAGIESGKTRFTEVAGDFFYVLMVQSRSGLEWNHAISDPESYADHIGKRWPLKGWKRQPRKQKPA